MWGLRVVVGGGLDILLGVDWWARRKLGRPGEEGRDAESADSVVSLDIAVDIDQHLFYHRYDRAATRQIFNLP